MPIAVKYMVCSNCSHFTPVTRNYEGPWMCSYCLKLHTPQPPDPEDDGSEEVKDV